MTFRMWCGFWCGLLGTVSFAVFTACEDISRTDRVTPSEERQFNKDCFDQTDTERYMMTDKERQAHCNRVDPRLRLRYTQRNTKWNLHSSSTIR